MNYQKLCDVLKNYIVEDTVNLIANCIAEHKVHLKICRPRSTKLGDYRSPAFNGKHTITINNDLNKYAFTVTLLHELAHLICYNQYKNKVKPHGIEWKNCFITLAKPAIDSHAFPKDIEIALRKYFQNPAASTCADPNLLKILQNYDETPSILVEDLKQGSVFELENGRVFLKGEKRRTRYYCICQHTKKAYLVSGVAKIKKLA